MTRLSGRQLTASLEWVRYKRTPMIVRKATVNDLPVLVEFTSLEAQEAEDNIIDLALLEKGVKTALEDPSVAIYWLMLDDNSNPAGSISALREWSDWNAGYYWWIQSLYIVPEERGKGHINALIAAVEEEMRSQGGIELRLYVHRHNEKAIRAYEKAGFESCQYEIMAKTGTA